MCTLKSHNFATNHGRNFTIWNVKIALVLSPVQMKLKFEEIAKLYRSAKNWSNTKEWFATPKRYVYISDRRALNMLRLVIWKVGKITFNIVNRLWLDPVCEPTLDNLRRLILHKVCLVWHSLQHSYCWKCQLLVG